MRLSHARTTSATASATIWADRRLRSLSYLLEGPPCGGPSCVLDPEGRIRTGICSLDRRLLYQLSYLGVVHRDVPTAEDARKMAQMDGLPAPAMAISRLRASRNRT